MAKAVALAVRASAHRADALRVAIVLGCAGALMLAERAFPLL